MDGFTECFLRREGTGGNATQIYYIRSDVEKQVRVGGIGPVRFVRQGLQPVGVGTGGVHGGNRLGGNAQADIVTFGRIAVQSSDAYLKRAK